MDRGAWRATVYVGAKSWTWLSDQAQHSTFTIYLFPIPSLSPSLPSVNFFPVKYYSILNGFYYLSDVIEMF